MKAAVLHAHGDVRLDDVLALGEVAEGYRAMDERRAITSLLWAGRS